MDIAEWIQDQLDLGGLITALVGALVLAIGQWLWRIVVGAGRRLRERKGWYERLLHLRTDVSLEYFEQELDLRAAFRRSVDGLVELIYPHKWFFVQALTNPEDVVVFYSVTSRDEKFQPPIWPSSTSPQNVPAIPHHELGSMTFCETFPDVSVGGVAAFFSGATAPSFFVEVYYGASPGYYLTYVVAINDAGFGFFDFSEVYSEDLFTHEVKLGRAFGDAHDSEDIQSFLSQPHIEKFRSVARPNCYGIIGQTFVGALPSYVGRNPIQVRTL